MTRLRKRSFGFSVTVEVLINLVPFRGKIVNPRQNRTQMVNISTHDPRVVSWALVSFPSACWMLTLTCRGQNGECYCAPITKARVSESPRNAQRGSQGSVPPRFPLSRRMRSPATPLGDRSPVHGVRRSRDIWDVSRSSASSGSSAGGSSSSSSSRNPVRIAARAITSCFGSHDGGLPPLADDSEEFKPPSRKLLL